MISETHIQTLNLSAIDKVLTDLDNIIQWSIEHKNRNGYFAALYKNITLRVKYAIEKGQFDDGERMAEFIHIFANSYIQPQLQFRTGKLDSLHPWYAVFSSGNNKLTIMQHLLLGVNTHINYDLANTAVTICSGSSIIGLCRDFVHINTILSSAINQVEKEISALSPILAVTILLYPSFNKKVLNFSLNVARAKSWECACLQASSAEIDRPAIRLDMANMTADLRAKILHPGIIGSLVLFKIRIVEWKSIKKNIQILNQKAWV